MKLKVIRYIVLFLLTLTLAGCSAPASTGDDFQSARIPVEIVNLPENIVMDIEEDTALVTTNKRQMSISFSGVLYNNSNEICRSIRYSLRGYKGQKKLFEFSPHDGSLLSGINNIDPGMSGEFVGIEVKENYSGELPDKIVVEIVRYYNY
jgi:hypothetical protein